MKKLLVVLILFCVPILTYAVTDTLEGEELTSSATVEGCSGCDVIEGSTVTSGGSGQAFSDDFSTDPSSRWTKLTGTNWTYDDVNDDVDLPADTIYIYTNTQTDTVSQYFCWEYKTDPDNAVYVGGYFRSTNNVAEVAYAIRWHSSSNYFEWRYCTGATCTTIETYTPGGSPEAGDNICIEVAGTGDSTTVDLWDFGDTVPARGSWGASDNQFTNNPASAADTGKYLGLYSGGGAETFDDFAGGDI